MNAGSFNKISLPSVRASSPVLIADDFVSVQPMSQPSGLIFHMQHKIVMSIEELTKYAKELFNCDDLDFIEKDYIGYALYIRGKETKYYTRLLDEYDTEKMHLKTFSRKYKYERYKQ
jgi:hypothetical protein